MKLTAGNVVVGVVVAVLVLLLSRFFNLRLQCVTTGVKIGFFDLIRMRLRGVDPRVVVHGSIAARQAGLDVAPRDLEAHCLAGGDVIRVVRALAAAKRANVALDFRRAAELDLAGRDPQQAVADA